MATGWILRDVNPADLKNHAVNIEIYGTQPIDSEMLASVKEFGVLEPPRCTKDMVLLSGHRRRQHAIAAKIKSMPVLVARHAISGPEQVIELVESNRQREKTMEQKSREFGKLAEAKAELARKRMLAGKKSDPTGKLPEGTKGEAKEQAAEELGMSRKTAEKALATVEKIDELEEAGETEKAQEIRDILNKGNVSAAAREAGVIPAKPDEHEPEPICDAIGRPVVKKLETVALSRTAFLSIARKLSAIEKEVAALADADGGFYMHFNAFKADIDNAKRALKLSCFYCACVYCGGSGKKGSGECQACKGCGWIHETLFKNAPEEMQAKAKGAA